ncbi:MAG: addiction module protein [Phycisphaerae bacterium]|nr:addiction module protein [Phycisphaerae bacterium]
MSMTAEQIAKAALALPSEARAMLADRLVESLDPAQDPALRQVWGAEAIRRRDEIRSGKLQSIPGDVGLAHVKSALARP